MTNQRIRILIVDDHPMVLKGLAATLEPEPDMEVVASAATGRQAVNLFRETRPDVMIMDLGLTPEMTGVEAIRAIRQEFPDAPIIVLSVHKGEEDIHQALKAGAITYLLKETLGDQLISVIRQVHAGGRPVLPDIARKLADHVSHSPLTAREIEVLRLVAQGLRNKEIAERLVISESTTQGHVRNILAKLQVNDRTGAVTVALKRGIIHIDA